MGSHIAVCIHGGAGALRPGTYSEAELNQYASELERILMLGVSELKAGKAALHVVRNLCVELENCEYFNAGRGAVLNEHGIAELDASIMDGSTENGSGVSGLLSIRNPIQAADLVLRESRHTLLAGKGAEDFCARFKLPTESQEYFRTEKRYQQYLKAKETNTVALDHGGGSTIGAVALDAAGNLAAGTSTGGLTFKQAGRVSDSAIIGAGTFASNKTCAVSGTGTGDKFILNSFANSVHLQVLLAEMSLKESTHASLKKVTELGGEGGCIAVDKEGNLACPFSSAGMFRGFYSSKDSTSGIGIYADLLKENFIH